MMISGIHTSATIVCNSCGSGNKRDTLSRNIIAERSNDSCIRWYHGIHNHRGSALSLLVPLLLHSSTSSTANTNRLLWRRRGAHLCLIVSTIRIATEFIAIVIYSPGRFLRIIQSQKARKEAHEKNRRQKRRRENNDSHALSYDYLVTSKARLENLIDVSFEELLKFSLALF